MFQFYKVKGLIFIKQFKFFLVIAFDNKEDNSCKRILPVIQKKMPDKKEILHIYFMPGLAANSAIFEYIKLPEDQFECHMLEWIIPKKSEILKEYAKRMTKYIKHENIVLIGVSFGGVVIQEMSSFLSVKRLIIISSVKCKEELPRRMRFAARTGFHK